MAYNTVKVKKYSDIIEEYEAVAAITPGHLLELTSAGKVQKHSVAGGNVFPMFALENELEGGGLTDDYATADVVQVWIPGRGDQVYALLADGESVVIGDFLESAGTGRLRERITESAGATGFESIVGQALEALDLSGSSGEEPTNRILVRVI